MEIMCGCGYGVATHSFDGMDGLRLHILGHGTCCRMIAEGDLIPTDFRMELWTSYEGTIHEHTSLMEVCSVNGQTITTYTLTDQRSYHFHEESNVWSLPKSKESINSIGDEW